MFRTYPESEMPLPPALATNGERSWHWIELPLNIAYFMVTIRVGDGSHQFHRTLLFSDISSVLQVSGNTNEGYLLERVDVLIPAYLHNGSGYKLAQIKEVWKNNGGDQITTFVLADGSTVCDSHCDLEDAPSFDLKLVARF